jgi:hypothetical protein
MTDFLLYMVAPHPVSQSRPWQHATFALHQTTTSICMEHKVKVGLVKALRNFI